MAFSASSGRGRAPLSEINVTPLVDVMLVLLIIFMVAAPMLTTGVSVDLPKVRATRMDIEETKLILTIDKTQKVYLGEAEVPLDRLEEALATNERLRKDKEVYVHADETVPYGFVVRVFASVRKAGVEKVGLVTDPIGFE